MSEQIEHGDVEGYDVIGDVHGAATKLHQLLHLLGYEERDGSYRHSAGRRQAIFVGDLVDRGDRQLETVRIAHDMAVHGHAQVVMGNHEYNAIAYRMDDPASPGEHLRRHTRKNLDQHEAFIAAVGFGSDDHDRIIDWFRGLPLWLDLGDLRVVHACWDEAAMATLGGDPHLDETRMIAGSTRGSDEYVAIESLCKGPEVLLPDGIEFADKGGHVRHRARFRWWDPDATTYRRGCDVPPSCPVLPDTPIVDIPVLPYDGDAPVLFGHYWWTWDRREVRDRTACVDHSAGLGGPLVAYRWSGEQNLELDHLVAAH